MKKTVERKTDTGLIVVEEQQTEAAFMRDLEKAANAAVSPPKPTGRKIGVELPLEGLSALEARRKRLRRQKNKAAKKARRKNR